MTSQTSCSGWRDPSAVFASPTIISLSSYYSPAGSTSLVVVLGANFYSYSIVRFGTLSPTVYFINSGQLQFYVPSTLSSGTYPVQVFNGAVGSNIVNYTIDNASGYWILNPNGTISNSNTGGLAVVGPLRPLGGALRPFVSVTTTPYTLPTNLTGGFIQLGAGSSVVNLFSPSEFGSGQYPLIGIFNNSGGPVTINTASGTFIGPGTGVFANGTVKNFQSNGVNWIVF